MAKRLLLKIFSGPNLGAEAILADGAYTLGRGQQCDLVLDDHAIADEHLKLNVAGDKVHAQPLGDARLLVGGKPSDGCTLPAGEYFTLGTTHLAVGFTDQQWILKPLPEIKLGDDAAPPPTRKDEAERAAAATLSKPRRRRKGFFIAATVLTLSGLLGWGARSFLTPSVQAGVVVPDGTGTALAALIAKHRVGETVKAEKTERGWIIQGHLRDRESVKALETDCRELLPPSAIRLWDSETLAMASGQVLAAYRVAVTARRGGPGEVIFDGRVPEAALWAKVRERIRHDVPDLLLLTDNVLTGAGRFLRDNHGRSVEAAAAPPPAGTYVILSDSDKEGAEGHRTEAGNPDRKADLSSEPRSQTRKESTASLQAPGKAGAAETGSQPKILYASATPLPSGSSSGAAGGGSGGAGTSGGTSGEKAGAPILAYQSVSVGATAWLRLADGTRVSVGGRIGGGYEVVDITDEAIEARKGDNRVVYRLREGS